MPFLQALAETFQVTEFDILFFVLLLLFVVVAYYFLSLHRIYEAAFGALVGLGIYILLSVLLIGNPTMGTQWGLFPFGLSVFFVSVSIYFVFILPILFSIHWGLRLSEPESPLLYTIQYITIASVLFYVIFSVLVYSIEQAYIFKVGNIFIVIKDTSYYTDVIKLSKVYAYIMSHQDVIIPLAVIMMLYKIMLSNLVNAAVLSVWYNLSNVWFYRQKDEGHYRVEFHEVGWKSEGNSGHHSDVSIPEHTQTGSHGGH